MFVCEFTAPPISPAIPLTWQWSSRPAAGHSGVSGLPGPASGRYRNLLEIQERGEEIRNCPMWRRVALKLTSAPCVDTSAAELQTLDTYASMEDYVKITKLDFGAITGAGDCKSIASASRCWYCAGQHADGTCPICRQEDEGRGAASRSE